MAFQLLSSHLYCRVSPYIRSKAIFIRFQHWILNSESSILILPIQFSRGHHSSLSAPAQVLPKNLSSMSSCHEDNTMCHAIIRLRNQLKSCLWYWQCIENTPWEFRPNLLMVSGSFRNESNETFSSCLHFKFYRLSIFIQITTNVHLG